MKPFEVQALRGGWIESTHLVESVVIDQMGRIVFQSGEIDRPIFPRSAIKMLQTLLLVESGAAQALGLEGRHLVLASSSHKGDPRHTDLVSEWLARLNLSEANLVCGAHDPDRSSVREQLLLAGKKPSKIHNNCSGKHCGLLSVCVHLGFDPRDYGNFDHLVQKALRKKLSEVFELDLDQVPWGVDGCGIPNSALSLRTLVSALPRFAARPAGQQILRAISEEPDLISGDGGFCTEVTRVTQGRIFAKTGAEGVFLALDPSQGLFFALKVRDGASRASHAAIANLLKRQGCFSLEEMKALDSFLNPAIRNWAGDVVGAIQVPSLVY